MSVETHKVAYTFGASLSLGVDARDFGDGKIPGMWAHCIEPFCACDLLKMSPELWSLALYSAVIPKVDGGPYAASVLHYDTDIAALIENTQITPYVAPA